MANMNKPSDGLGYPTFSGLALSVRLTHNAARIRKRFTVIVNVTTYQAAHYAGYHATATGQLAHRTHRWYGAIFNIQEENAGYSED